MRSEKCKHRFRLKQGENLDSVLRIPLTYAGGAT